MSKPLHSAFASAFAPASSSTAGAEQGRWPAAGRVHSGASPVATHGGQWQGSSAVTWSDTQRSQLEAGFHGVLSRGVHLLLIFAIGGDLGGSIDDGIFPVTMEIDPVRVYQAAR